MRLTFGFAPGDYVRLSGGGGPGGGGGASAGNGGTAGSGGGGGVTSGNGGTGGTVSIPGPGDCSAPDGRVVPYTTLADLERLIFGDWLRCRGNAYPSAFGVGLRISPDHTWSALERSDAGTLQPITTGFDGYGTWADEEVTPGNLQFYLHRIGGGGANYVVLFSDTGQMRMDFFTAAADYVRLGAAP
jgi:hypothetical protein